jgi:hypothetical protein
LAEGERLNSDINAQLFKLFTSPFSERAETSNRNRNGRDQPCQLNLLRRAIIDYAHGTTFRA